MTEPAKPTNPTAALFASGFLLTAALMLGVVFIFNLNLPWWSSILIPILGGYGLVKLNGRLERRSNP